MLQKIKEVKKLIEEAKNIALLTHIRMDPDTFWSAWALYFILKKIWKKVVLLNDEEAPKEFSFLWANEIISSNYNLKDFNPDLIISLDVASISQLAESYKNNKETIDKIPFIVIDHHITNNWFWTVNIIDSKASSTCELLFEILEEIDYIKYIEKKAATLLISWILTDTNVFYNTNVRSKTHDIAWKLLDLWADSRTSIFQFFKKKSINKTKLLWVWLSKIEIIELDIEWYNKNIVYTVITKEDFKKTNTNDRDTNWIIEHLINIEDTEIAFILYPLDNWQTKASFRSHTYNVSELAQKLWGWWHKQASWCSSDKNIEKFLEKIKTEIN